jgi:ribosomal protein S18 acetylase RimI-like enzyme
VFAVRRVRADEWIAYRDIRLRALADAPDAFGSTLAVEQSKADQYWVERVSSATASESQLPLVATAGDAFVGLVWGWIDPAKPDVAQVFQMWVAPEARGRGLGSRLLDAVVAWAREAQAKSVILRVTCGNTAANRLYERYGFKASGDPEPLRPGSSILAQPMTLALWEAA